MTRISASTFIAGSGHTTGVLLRLANERAANKIAVLRRLPESHADRLPDRFVVVTERRVRFAQK